MYFLETMVHQKPIKHGEILKPSRLWDLYVVFAWLIFLGLFNTRMLPELAPWNLILGRITTVSAYVQEGIKRDCKFWRYICDIKFFGIPFPLILVHMLLALKFDQMLSLFDLLHESNFTTTSPCQIFMVRLIPTPFSGFCTIAKICEKQKNSSSVYIKFVSQGVGLLCN